MEEVNAIWIERFSHRPSCDPSFKTNFLARRGSLLYLIDSTACVHTPRVVPDVRPDRKDCDVVNQIGGEEFALMLKLW